MLARYILLQHENLHKTYVKHLNCKLYYQQLHLKYLCNLARYWLQALWGWHESVETCKSVIISEVIVHLSVIVHKIHYHTSIRTDNTLTLLLADSNTRSSTKDAQPAQPSGHTDTRLWVERYMINLGLASGSNEWFFLSTATGPHVGSIQPIQLLEEAPSLATCLRHKGDTHLILRVKPGMRGAILPLPIYLHTMVFHSKQRHIYRQPRQYMPHRGTAMQYQCRNQGRAGEPFWGRGPKLSINFEEIEVPMGILKTKIRSWSLP